MKTLASSETRTEIEQRIAAVTPASARQWGAMSVGGMLCHLDDSYRIPLGEVAIAPVKVPIPRSLIKYTALRSPLQWPKNLRSLPAVIQWVGGTPPGTFADDQARLLGTLQRFCACTTMGEVGHAFFGRMSAADWMRWGYLHADHHLRQFSA